MVIDLYLFTAVLNLLCLQSHQHSLIVASQNFVLHVTAFIYLLLTGPFCSKVALNNVLESILYRARKYFVSCPFCERLSVTITNKLGKVSFSNIENSYDEWIMQNLFSQFRTISCLYKFFF